jgi:hypothetical protein
MPAQLAAACAQDRRRALTDFALCFPAQFSRLGATTLPRYRRANIQGASEMAAAAMVGRCLRLKLMQVGQEMICESGWLATPPRACTIPAR